MSEVKRISDIVEEVFTRVPRKRLIVIAFASGLTLFLWYRNSSTPKLMEQVKPNPAAAAIDDSSVESDQQLLPDRYNLAYQQLVSLRAQQIKSDASREINDRKSPCFRLTPTVCVEEKLQRINQRIIDSIGPDGNLTVSPSRALALNVEAFATLTALRGLGVVDPNTERLTEVYLRATRGEYSDLSGVARAIQGTTEYLDERRVDRLAATGKTEEIPNFENHQKTRKNSGGSKR